MDRAIPQTGWIVLFAALSEVATAAPSRVDAGLFDFNGAWLSEQNAAVDPSLLDGARRLKLDGVSLGSVTLKLDLQKAAPPASGVPTLRYTVGDARRDWLRSVTSSQPRRLSLAGAVERGTARGLSFSLLRHDGDQADFTDSRLAFARSGFSAEVRLRNVGRRFARSALTSDDEWNAAKDLLGWRQTDMRFGWTGTPGLSLSAEMNRGTKSDTGESRNRRRVAMDWKPGAGTRLSLYNEINTTGSRDGASRATKQGFAWNQSFDGYAFGLAQDTESSAAGKRARTRTLSFATPEKARTSLAYNRKDVATNGGSRVSQNLSLHARPSETLDLRANLATESGSGADRRSHGLILQWKPASGWNLDGQWRAETGAPGPAADLHLTGAPNPGLHLDARLQRITDPKNPYRKQDTLRLERRAGKDKTKAITWSVQASVLQTKEGHAARVLEADTRVPTSLGILTASWRDGGANILPGYTEVAVVSRPAGALAVKGRARLRDNAATTQTLDVTWKASERLTIEGSYERNPEDKAGHPRDLDGCRMAFHYRLTASLDLDVSHSLQSSGGQNARATDLSLKGKLDDVTTLDAGIAIHTKSDGRLVPAYHVEIKREVDEDHRFHLAVERQTRTVQNRDNVTATLQLVSDF